MKNFLIYNLDEQRGVFWGCTSVRRGTYQAGLKEYFPQYLICCITFKLNLVMLLTTVFSFHEMKSYRSVVCVSVSTVCVA